MNSLTIASRDLKSLFYSPLAWSILGINQLILAYMFLSQLDYYLALQPKLIAIENAPGVTDLVVAPLFGNVAVILLLCVPLMTMRAISDERRNKTISLLFSAPVTISDIVFGKFLAVFGFFMLMLTLTTLMPLSLITVGTLDYGKLAACIMALTLLMASFCASGLYFSSLTSQPIIAAASSFGFLLLLWILNWTGADEQSVLSYLSFTTHYEALLQGLINSQHLLYFLLFTAGFLILSIRHLDNERLQR